MSARLRNDTPTDRPRAALGRSGAPATVGAGRAIGPRLGPARARQAAPPAAPVKRKRGRPRKSPA